jgi:hypothetical protein
MHTSMLGVASTFSFVPEMNTNGLPPMSFVDRAKNVMIGVMTNLIFFPKVFGPISELSRKYVHPEFDLQTYMWEPSVMFVNVDEFIEFPRPITHKIHYIGGIGMTKPEKLEAVSIYK